MQEIHPVGGSSRSRGPAKWAHWCCGVIGIALVTGCSSPIETLSECEVPKFDATLPGLPEQSEPIAKIYKEVPYHENVPVPAFTEREKSSGMMIFRRPLSEPIYPQTRPRAWERVEHLSTFGARGQIVSLNFAVYPTRELKQLRVMPSYPLPEGQVRQLAYWKVRYPHYTTKDQYRRVPTYLFPATWCHAPALEPQQYVINMKIPADAPAGDYRGQVKIFHAQSARAVVLPYTVKVLPITLQKDPRKNYSAYFVPVRFRGHAVYRRHAQDEKWAHDSSLREYRLMVDYGFTRPPNFNLNYTARDGGKFYVSDLDKHLAEMREAGLPLPVFILTGTFANGLYREFTGRYLGNHVRVGGEVPEGFFLKIDRLAREFKKECEKKRMPPLIIGPIDEPAPGAAKFVRRIYEIFHRAGYRTFVTSCPFPEQVDDVVDFWSDQPFRTLQEVNSQAKKEYWCYPNHNAYEIKDVATMTRGGRMTYGFGLWKSNYNFLMPWIWRYYFNEHLLTRRSGGGGHLLTDQGEIIIEYDWENFREGIIDGKYIYTLQQMIVERTPTRDPQLQKQLAASRALLQEIWDSIPVMAKYLADGHWLDREFDGRRAQLAAHIVKLSAYPATNQKIAPSIIVNTKSQATKGNLESLIAREKQRGNLINYDLPPENFRNRERETQLFREGDTLHLQVNIDWHRDGTGIPGNKYRCGWPALVGSFTQPYLDFVKYGFFSYEYKFDSRRDGQLAVDWPHNMAFSSAVKCALPSMALPTRQEPGAWHDMCIATDMLVPKYVPQQAREKIRNLQFFLREQNYRHGDELHFYFRNLRLFGVKNLSFRQLAVAPVVKLPETILPWRVDLLGIPAKETLRAELLDPSGRVIARSSALATDPCGAFYLSKVPAPGVYRVKMEIVSTANQVLNTMTQNVTFLEL